MEKDKKWYQSPSNVGFAVACVILIPVLIINLYIMFQAKTNADEVPSIFGFKPFIVLSGSMEAEIQKGDLIITRIIDPEAVKVDDVIAFRDAEGTVTTHRIIDSIEKDGETYFITKGDNNSSQDQNLVELNDIEGIYVTRIPGIGSMMKSLSEPTTILVIGLGITIIFVISFMISSKRQRELERQEFLEYKRMKEMEEKEQEEKKERQSNRKKEKASEDKKKTTKSKQEELTTSSKKKATSKSAKTTTKKTTAKKEVQSSSKKAGEKKPTSRKTTSNSKSKKTS